jgi:nitroimidazol reductase NimA-like FMN-containing flavoprotein (pyridoxamine 5'-phosphate oxidase superfamily)
MATPQEIYLATATPEEIEELLTRRLTATIGTLNDNGSIHLAFVIFLYEDGLMYFETSSTTRKARNIRARPTASFILQGEVSSGRRIMAENEGSARLIEGGRALEINHRLRAKYVNDHALDRIDHAWNQFDDVAVEITPGPRWRSWCGEVFSEETATAMGGNLEAVWRPDD